MAPHADGSPTTRSSDSDPPMELLSDHSLIITTQKDVWKWTAAGITSIFKSGSAGIVAAKASKDKSGILAVADSQVVVLHDAKKSMNKSYKLRGTDGQVRLLKYTNDSKNLFFTTTLQNSVQSYSVSHSKLLDPSHTHPSPPNTLALSCTSHLLLSTSASPPTVHLQNLTLRTPPQQVQARASSAPVVFSAFHPERANIFLLAFADGVLAAYDATRLGNSKRVVPIGAGTGGEISHIADLHPSGTTITIADPNGVLDAVAIGGYDEFSRTEGMGNRSIGITAAEFVPGYRARVISVGADGRCCLVDFEGGEKGKAVLMHSWHSRGPAICLSIKSIQKGNTSEAATGTKVARAGRNGIGARAAPSEETKGWLAAVGRIDGKVLLFSSESGFVGEKTIDFEGGRIVDVEWLEGDIQVDGKKTLTNSRASAIPAVSKPKSKLGNETGKGVGSKARPRKRKSVGSILAAGREVEEQVVVEPEAINTPYGASQATIDTVTHLDRTSVAPQDQTDWEEVIEPFTANYMSLFSPVKGKPPAAEDKPSTTTRAKAKTKSEISAGIGRQDGQNDKRNEISVSVSVEQTTTTEQPPVVGPKMTPRPKTRRRSSRQFVAKVKTNASILSDIRSVRGKGTAVAGPDLALFAPYMKAKLIAVPKSPVRPAIDASALPLDEAAADIWLPEGGGNEIGKSTKSARKSTKSSSSSRKTKTVSFEESSGEANYSPERRVQSGIKVYLDTTDPIKFSPKAVSDFRSTGSGSDSTVKATPLVEVTGNRHYAVSPELFKLTTRRTDSDQCGDLREDMARMQQVLRDDVNRLHVDMLKQFQNQRKWFEELLASERKEMEGIKEENERLRRELFEVVQGEVRTRRWEYQVEIDR